MTDEFVLELPFRPLSLKNGQEIKRGRSGGRYITASTRSRERENAIALLALAQVRSRAPLFADAAVSLHVTERVDDETVIVRVRRIGPRSPAAARKRDLPNIFDAIADAMQRIVYENDSQIAHVEGVRLYRGMVA